MLGVTDLKSGVVFKADGFIFKVISYEHIKLGRGSASIKLKVKNLKTGAVTDKSFISGAKVHEAQLVKKKYQYLYKDGENAYFMDEGSYEQISIALDKLGEEAKFLKAGMSVAILSINDEPLSLELAAKMEFVIKETGPDIRGNSATNIFKEAILDNGLKVKVPLFMKAGDKVLVDTRTGEYSERVK